MPYRVYRCPTHGRMYSQHYEKECPRCGGVIQFLRENKTRPSNAFDMMGVALHREPRAPRPRQFSAGMVAGPMYEIEMSTFAPPPGAVVESDEDDVDWLPPPRYNITMRLTGAARTHRDIAGVICPGEHQLDTGWQRVAAAAGRLSANGIMRGSAQRHSGRGVSYRRNAKRSEEWCHLIADSLGGVTTPRNLVAASYSANTMMGAIEKCLHGRAEFEVRVIAYCSAPHVAEFFSYGIRHHTSHQALIFSIDAANTEFSLADVSFVANAFKDWERSGYRSAYHGR